MAQRLNQQDNSYCDHTGVDVAQKVIAAHAMVNQRPTKIAGSAANIATRK